ncbi:GtrA family protein [Massilia solisilvae]|uniref:GtrA family protein n=1 Tax=Massilia solisilvae TaxID=1811225 RepID=A0ABT2BE74_9BURK|nr:GtrA family protein [Massilia solisilvae]MCS0606740.1 GtrA family protein [Massilia solisilvae]
MHKLFAHWRQFAVYVSGGLLCALVDIGIMQALIRHGVHYASATTAGFAAGLVVNYAFHARVTFAANASPASFMRYLCIVGVNYLLTLACVAVFEQLAGSPLAGKLLSLPLVALNGYVLGKYWIFK